jgi:hypothetical protein
MKDLDDVIIEGGNGQQSQGTGEEKILEGIKEPIGGVSEERHNEEIEVSRDEESDTFDMIDEEDVIEEDGGECHDEELEEGDELVRKVENSDNEETEVEVQSSDDDETDADHLYPSQLIVSVKVTSCDNLLKYFRKADEFWSGLTSEYNSKNLSVEKYVDLVEEAKADILDGADKVLSVEESGELTRRWNRAANAFFWPLSN